MAIRSENRFETGEELCRKLASVIADDLRAGIAARGVASLAVSGGRTPLPLFKFLSQQELEWSKVTALLVDDRWVELGHKDSNESLVRDNLLVNHASAARFISLKANTIAPEEALDQVEERLCELPLPLDVVVLGMGEDGHTASWFPESPQLESALNPTAGRKLAWADPVTASNLRMTLTLPVVREAKHVFLHISGASKLPVLEKAKQDGPLNEMPIRHIIHSDKVALDVYWSK